MSTQLSAVATTRQVRLRRERALLAERESQLADERSALQRDEALLLGQHRLWADRWRAWAAAGGRLPVAAGLRGDRGLLNEMSVVHRARQDAWSRALEGFQNDLADWLRRWRAAEALAEHLERSVQRCGVLAERVAERRAAEESLLGASLRLRPQATGRGEAV